jgi:hypothetical protein
MATKSKFRKLNLGPSDLITRRNSVQGMQVVADYLDPITNQRTLLLERIEGGVGAQRRSRRQQIAPCPRIWTT